MWITQHAITLNPKISYYYLFFKSGQETCSMLKIKKKKKQNQILVRWRCWEPFINVIILYLMLLSPHLLIILCFV